MKYIKLYEEKQIEPGKWYYVEPDVDDDFSKYTEVPEVSIEVAKALLRSTRRQQIEGFRKYFGGDVFEAVELKEGETEIDILAEDEMRDVKIIQTEEKGRKKLILRYQKPDGEIVEKEVTKKDLEKGELSIDVFSEEEGRPQLKSDIFRFKDPNRKAKAKLRNTRLRRTRKHDNAVEIARSFKKASKRELIKGLQLYFEKILEQEDRA